MRKERVFRQVETPAGKEKVYFYGNADAESITAASLLKLHEMHHLRIVNGGWEAIQRMNSIALAKVKETSDNKKAI